MCPCCGQTHTCLWCLAEAEAMDLLSNKQGVWKMAGRALVYWWSIAKALWWGWREGRHWVDDRHLR